MTLDFVPSLLLGLFIFGLCYVVVGVVMENWVPLYNAGGTGVDASTDANFSISLIQILIRATPGMAIFCYVIGAWLNGLQEGTGAI